MNIPFEYMLISIFPHDRHENIRMAESPCTLYELKTNINNMYLPFLQIPPTNPVQPNKVDY